MTNDEVMRLLAAVEVAVPVERWVVDGIHVWPLFRAQVMFDNFALVGRKTPDRPAAPPSRLARLRARFGPQLSRVGTNLRGVARASFRDRAANDRLRPVDALLYSDGVSFVKLEGKYYDRFCDPIRERLAARGKSSLMVTPLGVAPHPRHTPSVFVQPRLDAAYLRGLAGNSLPHRPVELPGWDDAIRIAREAAPKAVLPAPIQLARAAGYVSAYEAAHERILARTRPQVVFIVSYYGNEAMALIRACRRRGIPTVDVQHGVISDTHWAYARWSRLPAGGFDLLPKYFWVWSESEAALIRAWADRSAGAHAPVVAGNLFLSAWRDGAEPFMTTIAERVTAIQHRAPAHLRHVLYTTNGFETPAQLGVLRDAITRSADRLFWWIRLHPAQLGARPLVEQALATAKGGYRIDDAAAIPLYGVLRHMALHVTEMSSVVIEAAQFGVPSVLLSPREAVHFREQIDQGWASVLEEGDDLADAVIRRLDTVGRSAAGTAEGRDPLDVILS